MRKKIRGFQNSLKDKPLYTIIKSKMLVCDEQAMNKWRKDPEYYNREYLESILRQWVSFEKKCRKSEKKTCQEYIRNLQILLKALTSNVL